MKIFIGVLVVLGVVGYNVWVFHYNNDAKKFNAALSDFNSGKYEKSIKVFQVLCDKKDDAKSCNMLGIQYENGYATQKDETKAVLMYQKSCDNGNDTGCYNLAVSYYNGVGIKANKNKAIEMLIKLCDEKKNKNACEAIKDDDSTENTDNSPQNANQNNQTAQDVNLKAIVENLYNTDFGEYQYLFSNNENGIVGANLASDVLLKALKQEFHEPVIMFDVRLRAGWEDETTPNILEARRSLSISQNDNEVVATFTQYGKERKVIYAFDCKGSECKIADIKQNNFSLLKALNEAARVNAEFEAIEANIENETSPADDPLENVMAQYDEMDQKLNAYYKQIMKGLEGEKKDKFRNAQRAWVKFATDAPDLMNAAFRTASAKLSITTIQTNFLKAVIDGKTPTITDNQSAKYYEDEITQLLKNTEMLSDYQKQTLSKIHKAWQKYASLKKEVATMMGLDGDEIYRQECKFWAEFLPLID